jgi:Cys-rich repeat protein
VIVRAGSIALALALCVTSCGQGEIRLLPGPTPMAHPPPACPPPPMAPDPAPLMACDDAGTCPMMEHCDPASGLCVDCLTDMDCGAKKTCRTSDHTCVACLTNADCMPGQACDPATNRCVAPQCIADAQSPAEAGPAPPPPDGGN